MIEMPQNARVRRRPAGDETGGGAPETVDFGFADVPVAEKTARVREVFDRVAGRYDLMNDVMSGGLHRLWKDALVDWLAPRPGMRLVDVAGGTGDIAFRCRDAIGAALQSRARRVARGEMPAHAASAFSASEIVVCDRNAAMLAAGRGRATRRDPEGTIRWICGDGEALPFPERSFDACTIAFGLRNVTRREAALAEARRVLRPGGRFLCLEFSRVTAPGLRQIYDRYSFSVLPALGGLVAGQRQAYQYLVESIRRFPDQDQLAGMLAEAGFERVRYRNLAGGIAALHSGWRL